jgi:hypothetical protein
MAKIAPKPKSFYQRFALNISLDEAKQKFVARAHNRIFEELYLEHEETWGAEIQRAVADALRKRVNFNRSFSGQIGDDFFDVLKAIEAMHIVASQAIGTTI